MGGAFSQSAVFRDLLVDAVSAEATLYTRWENLLPTINVAGAPVVLAVKPRKNSLFDEQHLFPDLVVYTADSPRTPLHVEVAGDLKPKPGVPFEAKHYNQIQRYAAAQLDRQVLRAFFITFLANHDSIEFFKWTRGLNGDLDFTRTDALPLRGMGGWVLMRLLSGPPLVRGTVTVPPLALPDGARVAMLEQLGEGASASVFKGAANGREMVVKLFKTTEQLKCEVQHLQVFAAKLAGETRIPTVVGFDELQLLVALSPVALNFSLRSWSSPALTGAGFRVFFTNIDRPLFAAIHAQWLVQTLQTVAGEKVVHRDVSPSNIYLLENDKARGSLAASLTFHALSSV